MNLKSIITSAFFLKSVFAISLFILIFISGVSYKHSSALKESSEKMMHAYEMQSELENLISNLKNAEIGQRGYLITKDSSFLEPYIGSRSKAQKSLYILKQLSLKNKEQLLNIDSLDNLVSMRFSKMSTSFSVALEEPNELEKISSCLMSGKKVMDEIREHVHRMNKLETKDLKESRKNLNSQISFTPLFTLLLLFFSILVFVIAYLRINNDLDFFKKANKELKVANAIKIQAEEIGSFGTWVWNFETNEIIFSENHYHLLGIDSKPQPQHKSLEDFLQYVHKSDRHIVVNETQNAIHKQTISDSFFRIIRADGALRYFHSTGRVITDPKGAKTFIGIYRDITEKQLRSIALKKQNAQLEESIKELSSFNYVASHDLQEPLRIIQTYISRIDQKEKDNLSETGVTYFNRIRASANRMQVLINDLLLFSRTNKIEEEFEKTDFNDSLQIAKEELAQIIEEKQAVIEAVDLPTLKVIPHQIQQLFINIIGNSLKYAKDDAPPVITITCEKVDSSQYPFLSKGISEHFCKICFTDNGIGFEQEFAENVFVLFKRLHHKNEYHGTGIGLAICKKIAENHSGFITAESKSDIGTTIKVFFPL